MKDTITPLNYTKEAIKDLSVMEKGLRSNVDWPPESPDNQYHLNK